MRRNAALVVGVCCLLVAGAIAARAADAPAIEACATDDRVLGLSRVVEVDTAEGPQFGHSPASPYDFLHDGEVVLTFDDGPLRPHTHAVLQALAAHCTKATFFMVGRMAVADPAMVREVAREGHTVAAHTWSHARLQDLEADKAEAEIELGFSAVARAMEGPIAPFFRFPYLRPGPDSIAYLKARHIASFGIDVDSRDFRTRDGPTVHATVLAQLAGRRKGILLFHDIQPSTAHALKDILDALKDRGFKVVHLVPKDAAATLAQYDTLADREIAHRNVAAAKRPLASRSLVWPQAPTEKGSGEVLPWSRHDTASPPATKTKASNNGSSIPWYKQLLP